MGVPLTTLTQKPVQYNTFSFGGDDTSLGKSGIFGKIVEWDLNERNDTFKANLVFFVKKAFAFFDSIGAPLCCFCWFGIGGTFANLLKVREFYQTGPARNADARMKIVTALGGEAACRNIAVVQLNPADFQDYLKIRDNYFARGQSKVQGEDPAGRKFVSLRTIDRTNGQVHVFTCHQRYRETCISPNQDPPQDGSLWTTNNDNDSHMVQVGTRHTLEFLEKIRANRHERFSIAPKP